MTSLNELNGYLRRWKTRLRLFAAARGIAIFGATACLLTVLLVWIGNRFQFAEHIVLPLRILLFLGMATALLLALAVPLLKINKRWVTRLAERRMPGFEQRLLTVTEHSDPTNPFTELLAEDALRVVHDSSLRPFAPIGWLSAFIACAVVCIGVVVWLVASAPGYWGYGASLLWTGKGLAGMRPLYEIVVQPGNKTVRRRSDQIVTAELMNFSAPEVMLHAKYRGALQWEQTPMQAEPNGNGYQFLFAGLSDGVEYYIEAGKSQSKHYHLGVKDLPVVKHMRVALHFPAGLQLQDVVNENTGDVRAVQGSKARISVLTDRPLPRGELILGNGSKIPLFHGDDNWLTAELPVEKDGNYHVAAIDDSEAIRISEDYFIEAKKDEPATVKIVYPGRDPHVSPIEEVPVRVEASDDYGVKDLQLHYSVNGGPEQTASLSGKKNAPKLEGKSILYFENFKLVPGDLVSFYATARDAKNTSRTDIVFAQAEPFDYRFKQSQQAGSGGMGGGGDSEQISERQKEIIAATWNQVKNGPGERSAVAENANFLSQLEGKLGEQAKTLAERMGSRELAAESPEFKKFSEAMNQASQEMTGSVGNLKTAKWQGALPSEQRALQFLLRAEATFRDIQIAYGKSGSQGMGGGGASRDLARMLDLELDKNKNQYETGQSASASPNEQQKGIDEALERLKALAKRQQELAAQRQPEQVSEQRWQEEQLRREAEQLRRQIEQLSKNNASSGQQEASSSSSSGAQGQQSQSGANSARQAADALSRAEDEMRKATASKDASSRQRAADHLAEAAALLQNRQQTQAGSSVSEMAQRAQQITEKQHEINNQSRSLYGGPSDSQSSSTDMANGSMPEMRDPRGGFRSWYWRQLETQPRRPATSQEKSLAGEKERLGEELQNLQQQIQQQAQNLQAQQPGTSSQLRKALSAAEGEELALRMKKSAEWMRDGFGSRTYGMENSVTKGVEQLSRDLQTAQKTLNGGGDGKGGAGDPKTLEALMQVRKLRQQLAAEAGRSGDSTQQSNAPQDPPSKEGEMGGIKGSAVPYSSIQEAESAMSGLRRQLGPGDKSLSRQLNGAIGSLRHLDDSRAGVMEARLNQEILPTLERLEGELSRRLTDGNNAPRTTDAERAPEQYRDAVATYFRKLSQ